MLAILQDKDHVASCFMRQEDALYAIKLGSCEGMLLNGFRYARAFIIVAHGWLTVEGARSTCWIHQNAHIVAYGSQASCRCRRPVICAECVPSRRTILPRQGLPRQGLFRRLRCTAALPDNNILSLHPKNCAIEVNLCILEACRCLALRWPCEGLVNNGMRRHDYRRSCVKWKIYSHVK